MKDRLIDRYFPVLSHGFIALKDVMGTDQDIEMAARVSYGRKTRKVSDTRNLLRYLMRHRHSSPLEMCELKFHIALPIVAMRQLVRHRTANLNELSGRYSVIPDIKETTSPDKWRLQAKDNKQGSSGYLEEWPDDWQTAHVATPGDYLTNEEIALHHQLERVYQERLRLGVAREQARKDLPLSTYTVIYWKIDLRNLLHFIGLRSDSHAQEEIRAYSDIMLGMVKELFPLTYEAFIDYQMEATTFSRQERHILDRMLNGVTDIDALANEYGLSKRELTEFRSKLKPAKTKDYTLDLSQAVDGEHFMNLYQDDN